MTGIGPIVAIVMGSLARSAPPRARAGKKKRKSFLSLLHEGPREREAVTIATIATIASPARKIREIYGRRSRSGVLA